MQKNEIDPRKVYLVTGAAGFIGYFLTLKLLKRGCKVIGIDNLNDYYDVNLKKERLSHLLPYEGFAFIKQDIADKHAVIRIFAEHQPDIVVHLAAQAGVRYSLENPDVYIQSNIIGFYNILEACKDYPVDHLVYASSSSVYGANEKVPFEEKDFVDHPVSLYAATKKSNELMAYTYSHLFGVPVTGLRFFTVYGPMGRPDMAYYSFTKSFFDHQEIKIFNNGDAENDLYRDFTYVDDIVEGIERILPVAPVEPIPYVIYNIGNNRPEKLMVFIETLENCLSNKLERKVSFNKKYEALKPGDVPATFASTDRLEAAVGFKPTTSISEGLQKFVDWYVDYHALSLNPK